MKSDSRLPKKLSTRPRLLLSALLAGIVAALLPPSVHVVSRLLCSWDAFTFCFLCLTLRVMLCATPEVMRRFARQEDEGRALILSLITIAACISVVAIGLILQDKGKENSLLWQPPGRLEQMQTLGQLFQPDPCPLTPDPCYISPFRAGDDDDR